MGLMKFASSLDFRRTSDVMEDVVAETFNATIQIIDPNIEQGTYNRLTNTVTGHTPTVLWTGPARIQGMRWPNVATPRAESVSLRSIIFTIPHTIDINVALIREGFRIRVLNGGEAPEFEAGMYTITSSVNSSYAWNRRIETLMDQGVVVTN